MTFKCHLSLFTQTLHLLGLPVQTFAHASVRLYLRLTSFNVRVTNRDSLGTVTCKGKRDKRVLVSSCHDNFLLIYTTGTVRNQRHILVSSLRGAGGISFSFAVVLVNLLRAVTVKLLYCDVM